MSEEIQAFVVAAQMSLSLNDLFSDMRPLPETFLDTDPIRYRRNSSNPGKKRFAYIHMSGRPFSF